MLSEEALQIAEKRREVKGKGEMERYTQMNAEFQRTARRDKKAFLSDQCKQIEENNRMGISFLFSFALTSLLFSAICKASSHNHFTFFHFFF